MHAQLTCKHILPLFADGGCVRGAYRILVNPTSGGSQPLGGIPTNLYLSVSTVTVPSWRRGFLSWCVEYVSSEHYCQAEVFCSWYMQIVQVYSPDKICIVLCYHPYLVSCCSVIPTSCKYKLLVPSWSSYCFSQYTHPHSCKPVIGLILPAIKSTGYLYHCSQTYSIQIKMNLFIQFVQPPFSWIQLKTCTYFGIWMFCEMPWPVCGQPSIDFTRCLRRV